MNVQEQLHRVVRVLDGHAAKQQLQAVIDDLDEEQAYEALKRIRGTRYAIEGMGFAT